MTLETLRALHAVIGDAISTIESTYNAHSLDFPSLDVPYYANTSLATKDQQRAEELRGDPAVFGATNAIVAACGQLTAAVHKPFFSLIDAAQGVSFRLIVFPNLHLFNSYTNSNCSVV